MKLQEPKTKEQWQEAVNCAYLCRILADCMMYGLVVGPTVNVERCDDLIERGRAQGVRPDPNIVADPGAYLVAMFNKGRAQA